MSYTDWENMKKIFDEEEDYEYFMGLEEDIKDKLTSILPFPIREMKDIPYGHLSSFRNVIEGFVNTVGIVRNDRCNDLPINITEIPDGGNFIACYSESYNSKYNSHGYQVAITAKDLLRFYQEGSREKLYCSAINPNLARLCKLLYGTEISDINSSVMFGSFLGHLSDNHTTLYKKNMGYDFDKDRLCDEEKEASGNWLTEDLHRDISSVINYVAPYTNYLTNSIESVLNIFKVVELINKVELNKSKYIGYEYSEEVDFSYNRTDTSGMLAEFLESNYSEYSKTLLTFLNDIDDINEVILNSMLFSHSGDASYKNRIESIVVGIGLRKGIDILQDLILPENFDYIVRKYDIDIQSIDKFSRIIVENEPKYKGVTKKELRDISNNYVEELFIFRISDNSYNAYTITGALFNLTTIATAMKRKLEIGSSDIFKYVSIYKDRVDKELLGEASVIHYILKHGLQSKLPFLNKFRAEDEYQKIMIENNLPIGKLLKKIEGN